MTGTELWPFKSVLYKYFRCLDGFWKTAVPTSDVQDAHSECQNRDWKTSSNADLVSSVSSQADKGQATFAVLSQNRLGQRNSEKRKGPMKLGASSLQPINAVHIDLSKSQLAPRSSHIGSLSNTTKANVTVDCFQDFYNSDALGSIPAKPPMQGKTNVVLPPYYIQKLEDFECDHEALGPAWGVDDNELLELDDFSTEYRA